ncbi:hypothetical protein ACH5AL_14155 [Actinacidiphila glaucinigra]|uniref:hypothetical protein n=1 Tax=Actinacidiphila glaucinigra TaxID=235986 RepID=UPI00379D132B
MYSAAQQSGNPSPAHLPGIAVGFLPPGLFLLHRRRQLAQEPPVIGRPAGAVARLRLAYLVSGWLCTGFGAFALLVSAPTALTSGAEATPGSRRMIGFPPRSASGGAADPAGFAIRQITARRTPVRKLP